ncbi:MAG: hypothetical protein M5U19_06015 [Microthrixaceae bacterium]|nr:hypothetical protein [Microthrixaceae bacterium]
MRSAIGSELALGVRICGDELIEGGTTIEDAVEVARMVEATGQVDYINTSIGVATASLFMIEASMHIPPGYAMFIPSAIRRAVELPVVGVGRFRIPFRPSERWPKVTATWWVWSVVRSRTRVSWPRPAPVRPTTPGCA